MSEQQSWPLNNSGWYSQEGGREGLEAGCRLAATATEEAGDKVRTWQRTRLRASDAGPRDGPKETVSATQRSFEGTEKVRASPWVPQALSSTSSWCYWMDGESSHWRPSKAVCDHGS